MPTCTKEHPAPPGEPIYPGAVAAKWADPVWEHPDTVATEGVTSIDFNRDFDVKCKWCGGQLPRL